MSVSGSTLREAMGCFATGVALVTAFAEDGTPRGITVNSLASVSLSPPLILWCLGRSALNYDAFAHAEFFVVHILRSDQQHFADHFAVPDRAEWGDIPWTRGEGGAPVIDGCEAVLECRTWRREPAGDHLVLFGEVAFAHVAGSDDPLLFHAGGYRHFQSE